MSDGNETPNQTAVSAVPTVEEVLGTPNEAEVLEFETYRQDLVQADSELKQCIEQVLEMRVQAAELEASLTSFYCPTLQAKLKHCQELAAKCEEFRQNYQTVEPAEPALPPLITDDERKEYAEAQGTVGNAGMEDDQVDFKVMLNDLFSSSYF